MREIVILIKCSAKRFHLFEVMKLQLSIPDTVQEMYSKDFDMLRLSTHLNMLPGIVKQYNAISVTPIKNVTTVLTVCSMMNEVPGTKSLHLE